MNSVTPAHLDRSAKDLQISRSRSLFDIKVNIVVEVKKEEGTDIEERMEGSL